jgi:hypothetical protein
MNWFCNDKIRRRAWTAIALGVYCSAILLNAQTSTKKPLAPPKPASTSAKSAATSAGKPGAAATKGPAANGPSANHPGQSLANAQHHTDSPGPRANSQSGPGGGRVSSPTPVRTATGHMAPAGSRTATTRDGAITRRADGRVSDVHDTRRGMDIHHGLDGSRRVSVQRRDGSRLVAERGRRGFVERPYQFHGHDFARRSYYYHGVHYDRYYNHYYYHGVYMDVYAPPVYYAPAFYGWAYNAWPTPVTYAAWGWAGAPWFGFYGAYFTPWNTYPSAAFWLADYIVAADLQAVYAAQVEATVDAAPVPTGLAMPRTLNECENSICGTWNWDGARYNATWSNGSVGTISVVRWDGTTLVLTRADTVGATAGMTVTYTGRVTGDTTIAGAGVYVYPGHNLGNQWGTWRLGWNASSPTSIVTPAQAPTTGDSQPASLAGAAPLTPDVKQAIADEVKSQLALGYDEAAQVKAGQDVDGGSSGIARIIQDVAGGRAHIFVVGDSLDVTDASTQQECHLSEGDVVQMVTAPASDATAADVIVKSSKGGVECTANVAVAVNLSDLQEMQNHMREQIDAGLKDLQSKAGSEGLPQPPSSARAAPSEPQYAAIAPPPSPQDETELEAQSKEATAAENEAQQGGTPSASNPVPSTTVAEIQLPMTAAAIPPVADQGVNFFGNESFFYENDKLILLRSERGRKHPNPGVPNPNSQHASALMRIGYSTEASRYRLSRDSRRSRSVARA